MRISEYLFKSLIRHQDTGHQKIMAAIDDLKTSVANLASSVTKELAAIATALNNANSNDPAIEAAVTQINDLAATVDKETATLTGTPAV